MHDRRRLLRTAGVALTAGLAGCAGDTGNDGESNAGDGTAGGEAGTATETETETEATTEPTTETEAATQTATESAPTAQALVVNNVGFQAWEVVEDDSGAVAPTGEENPTMTFEVGRRYVVENRGWSSHPFALRDADDAALLSQGAEGEFEGDADVNWVDDGDSFAFTVTEPLAADVDYYICTVHSAMRGAVETSG